MSEKNLPSSKEEAKKMRIQLGEVKIPEDKAQWFKWVAKDGKVYAQPPVNRELSEAEIAKRKAKTDVKRAGYSKEGKAFGLEEIADGESIKEYRTKLTEKKEEKREADKVAGQEKRLAEKKAKEAKRNQEQIKVLEAREKEIAKKKAKFKTDVEE